MKYLKISNQGLLDIRLIALMGSTTKANDQSKIGQFGTGLKYAIAYLVREKNNFKVFIGETEVCFSTKIETIADNEFEEIYCDGKSMSITTRYGYQWKAWEAIREIWCNAIDEGGTLKEVTEEYAIGQSDTTTFYIEVTEDIEAVITTWGDYFLEATPIFENDKIAVYPNSGDKLRIYKNNTLIHIDGYYKSKFMYDFKTANLNELRQYIGHAQSVIAEGILSSNKELVSEILQCFKNNNTYGLIEFNLDYDFLIKYNEEHVAEIFDGWLFLHPNSDRSNNAKSVKVNKSLFYVLQKCGLMTEKISSVRGRSYGSSGYGYDEDEEITYSEITNGKLEKRIKQTLEKFKSDLDFEVVMPKDSDFDVLITGDNEVVFSNDLHNQSDADLEATVLIALFQQKEGNIYKALKRLIKFARSNNSFEKIFFGKI